MPIQPTPDLYASLHTVEIDRGTHREQRSYNVRWPLSGQPVNPGDDPGPTHYVHMVPEKIAATGADPERCLVIPTVEGDPVPLEAGELGLYEHVGPGRLRFVGPVEDFMPSHT